jgi:glyoxylase-like metal-dependent hydrolase (beta-lactamase superfamily II)
MTANKLIDFPQGSTTVEVHLINSTDFGPAQINRFMSPPVPGLETFKTSPSHSFYIKHPSGRKLIFDLGIRKDYQNYSKVIADYLPTTKYDISVFANVADILKENNVDPGSVEAVVWSHWHWDHVTKTILNYTIPPADHAPDRRCFVLPS